MSYLFTLKQLEEAALIFDLITIPLLCQKHGYSDKGLTVSKDGKHYTDDKNNESGDIISFIKRKISWYADYEAIEELVEIAYKEGILQ